MNCGPLHASDRRKFMKGYAEISRLVFKMLEEVCVFTLFTGLSILIFRNKFKVNIIKALVI